MTTTRMQVADFHLALGAPVRIMPESLTVSERELRAQLLMEEVIEHITLGLGIQLVFRTSEDNIIPLTGKYADGVIEARHFEGDRYDPIETADGLGDINVIIHGTAHVCGFNLDKITDHICDSNMSKMDPETGKGIINGYTEGYRAAGWDGHRDTPAESNYDPSKPVGKGLKGPNFWDAKPGLPAIIAAGNWPGK